MPWYEWMNEWIKSVAIPHRSNECESHLGIKDTAEMEEKPLNQNFPSSTSYVCRMWMSKNGNEVECLKNL